MSKNPVKNHVYKAMSQDQANNETMRLLNMAPRGGKDTRDAVHGLMVLANIGCLAAMEAIHDL